MIKTADFYIDSLQNSDAESLSKLMVSNKTRFQRFFPGTLAQNLTLNSSEEYILKKNKKIKTNAEFTYAIKDNDTHKIVGLIIIKELDWNTKQGELAYCIGEAFGGKGWMSKAISEVSKYAFAELNIEKLQIIVHISNIGSVKVAEKCKFIWQKTLKNEFTPPNETPLDMELYELKK